MCYYMKVDTSNLEKRCDDLEKEILKARGELADMRDVLKSIRRAFYRRESKVKN